MMGEREWTYVTAWVTEEDMAEALSMIQAGESVEWSAKDANGRHVWVTLKPVTSEVAQDD